MIIVNILLLSIGFFALVKGADMFVNGSSSIAARFHVPSLIIGLTLVAMGTSAPELAVSISAALQGSNEIAISNVVGSNLFNLLGILGISSVIHPIEVNVASYMDLIILVTASMITLAFCLTHKKISRLEGGMMLAMYFTDMAYAIIR